ncbi:hypothetical protein AAFF_G00183540 [Aldrovandia affinis]|uniref:Uncharacterized protein n=1 Tax=Aldrovandia affinis TaxID=143900 RepID=A0AAD7RMN5_9TELE|nr:hypothetical protein AAFF_G00183540 [Aldrovandia affinis]
MSSESEQPALLFVAGREWRARQDTPAAAHRRAQGPGSCNPGNTSPILLPAPPDPGPALRNKTHLVHTCRPPPAVITDGAIKTQMALVLSVS